MLFRSYFHQSDKKLGIFHRLFVFVSQSRYGERKTIWYPMYPQMLIDHPQREIIDGIYLTSYLIDDSNYYMGAEWREIYVQPEQINNEYLSSNFEVKKIINIDAKEVYENIPARAVLLVKRK